MKPVPAVKSIEVRSITLRTRLSTETNDLYARRFEVVVETLDGERWITHSESIHGMVETTVYAAGVTKRPSRVCPITGKKAKQRYEAQGIKNGSLKPLRDCPECSAKPNRMHRNGCRLALCARCGVPIADCNGACRMPQAAPWRG